MNPGPSQASCPHPRGPLCRALPGKGGPWSLGRQVLGPWSGLRRALMYLIK